MEPTRTKHEAPRQRPAALGLIWVWMAATVFLASCSEDSVGPGPIQMVEPPDPVPVLATVAVVDVNLVSMDGDEVLSGQTVLVESGRVTAVGATDQVNVPDSAFVIDGQGRYLFPGLADMHVHLTSRTFEEQRGDFMLFLANGVTTVRVMWGGRGDRDERDRIEAGEVIGPSLLVASPGLDAPGGPWEASTPAVSTPQEARERVRAHASERYDFIKVYNRLPLDVYDAIIDESAQAGLPVVGHVPSQVGIEHVQDAGQLSLEHLIGFKLEASSPFTGGALDMPRIRELAARSAASGVWHTPTTAVVGLSTERVAAISTGSEIRSLSPGMRSFFEGGFHHGLSPSTAQRETENHQAITLELHQQNVGLLVGTDAGFGWMLPGFSMHDELDIMVGAGLSPYQALRGATSEAARSVGLEGEFGRIAVGLRGDLMLVDGNPLSDLSTLRDPSGVLIRGRWFTRDVLRETLLWLAQTYQGS